MPQLAGQSARAASYTCAEPLGATSPSQRPPRRQAGLSSPRCFAAAVRRPWTERPRSWCRRACRLSSASIVGEVVTAAARDGSSRDWGRPALPGGHDGRRRRGAWLGQCSMCRAGMAEVMSPECCSYSAAPDFCSGDWPATSYGPAQDLGGHWRTASVPSDISRVAISGGTPNALISWWNTGGRVIRTSRTIARRWRTAAMTVRYCYALLPESPMIRRQSSTAN